MSDSRQRPLAADASLPAMARMPTGAKLFLILSAALLPLALIAVFAALQTTRTADLENRAQLRVASGESARALAIELIGDANAMRSAVDSVERDPGDTASCARLTGVFAPGSTSGLKFALIDATGQLRCGSAVAPGGPMPAPRLIGVRLLPGEGLTLTVAGAAGDARATAFFPTAFLAEIAHPSGFLANFGSHLRREDTSLTLRTIENGPLSRHDRTVEPVGIDGLSLGMDVQRAPITSPVLVAMFAPILMWAAAAGIGWFVVDRLLIRPLRKLRRRVGAYKPGAVFDPLEVGAVPAQEIRELGETFGDLSRMIQTHESEMAEGLVRQTKLTREVHHRVKNNLQVIASLINLHSRSAANAEAMAAYAAIQRRVDALAVVHRHHFAEMEDNRGLGLRSVTSELAANIRATAGDRSRELGIVLEVEPFLVSQDSAVAVTFLITEIVELAMNVNPAAQLRIALRADQTPDRALLRISSPSLIETETLRKLLTERYGRVMEGLSRQLRSKLVHEPLIGAFEISIAVLGRD